MSSSPPPPTVPNWAGNTYLSIEQFKIVAPEFGDTDDFLLGAMLNEAANELDPDMWGYRLASGHHYLTAHKLALSPMGQNARMLVTGEAGETTYEKHFNSLVKKLGLGIYVAGNPFCSNGGPVR